MELLDRYLKAVAKGLPESQRDDILKELSEDIHSEMEEKESELGRPLTNAEQEAILRQHGNPLLLAARYRQDQRSVAFGRQIIGPVIFPFYIKVLSFNLGLSFVVIATIFAALAFGGQRITFSSLISSLLLQLVIQLGAVTLIFSLIERHLNKHPDKWNMGGIGSGVHFDLKIDSGADASKREMGQVSRFESISVIVASLVALAWLGEVQQHPFLIFGPAAYFMRPDPIWFQVYPVIVLLTSLVIVQAAINLFRPDWVRFRTVAQVLLQLGSLVVIFFLLKAGSWVGIREVVAADAHEPARQRAIEIVNQSVFYGLAIGAVITAVQIVRRINLLARGKRNAASSPSVDVKC